MLRALMALIGLSQAAGADPLADLDRWLLEHRPQYYAALNAGATEAQLDAFEARFGVTLPQDLRRLYAWRNGHGDYLAPAFVLNHVLEPLENVANSKAELDAMIGHDFAPGWWEQSWIPFTTSYGGDHIVVDTETGRVLTFYHDDATRPDEAASITEWLAALVQSMNDGTYEIDGEPFRGE